MKRMRKCNDEVYQLAKDQALVKKLQNKRFKPFCLCLPYVVFVTRRSKNSLFFVFDFPSWKENQIYIRKPRVFIKKTFAYKSMAIFSMCRPILTLQEYSNLCPCIGLYSLFKGYDNLCPCIGLYSLYRVITIFVHVQAYTPFIRVQQSLSMYRIVLPLQEYSNICPCVGLY